MFYPESFILREFLTPEIITDYLFAPTPWPNWGINFWLDIFLVGRFYDSNMFDRAIEACLFRSALTNSISSMNLSFLISLALFRTITFLIEFLSLSPRDSTLPSIV